jgi:hypothetical protein
MLPVTPGVDDGRRVLIVYESEDKPTTRLGKRWCWTPRRSGSTSRRNVIPTAGGSKIRTWTRHTWMRVWQRWLKRDRESLPWIMISNGTKKAEGPLPLTIELTQALIDGVIK